MDRDHLAAPGCGGRVPSAGLAQPAPSHTGPEAGHRVELMADAFGTSYLTHSRVEAPSAKRVLHSAKSPYDVGESGRLR
ncbi:hypothetical protein [Streptomyces litmocidini]|uniref:hypothetical protein n=1 Tax=Streptomyces litmocidini TaxID=67318 RepID=UPI0037033E93